MKKSEFKVAWSSCDGAVLVYEGVCRRALLLPDQDREITGGKLPSPRITEESRVGVSILPPNKIMCVKVCCRIILL